MTERSKLDDAAAAELHNRLAKQIVSQIVNEPITAGGSMSDVMARKRVGWRRSRVLPAWQRH